MMFRFVAEALTDTYSEIAKIPTHYATWNLQWRRDVLADLLKSVGVVQFAENALNAVYAEVAKVAFETLLVAEVAKHHYLRIWKIKSKIDSLNKAVTGAGDALICVFDRQHKQPTFLKHNYICPLQPQQTLWLKQYPPVNLFGLTCPTLLHGNGEYLIQFPITKPACEHVPTLPTLRHTKKSLNQFIRSAVPIVAEHIQFQTVDVLDPAQLQPLLSDAPHQLEALTNARQQLVTEIKTHLALDDLLG